MQTTQLQPTGYRLFPPGTEPLERSTKSQIYLAAKAYTVAYHCTPDAFLQKMADTEVFARWLRQCDIHVRAYQLKEAMELLSDTLRNAPRPSDSIN
jgi:hypothetical protein